VVLLVLLLMVVGVVWFVIMDQAVIEQLTDDLPSTPLEITPAEERSSIEQIEQPLPVEEVQEDSVVETPQTNVLPTIEESLSELMLQVGSESWTEVYDARGERVVYDLLKAGTARTVHGVEPFKVFLGAAENIRIELNGEFYDHSQHIRKGLARFELGKAEEITDQE
jgi:cytoskeleton protein RodZ